jgi:hypothetical protein
VKTIVGKLVPIAACIAIACALAPVSAEEDVASKYVKLITKGACDDKNNRLWLTNTHAFKTIATTVTWKAAGGKDLKQQFFPGPSSEVEIGCAAESAIVDAQFAAF